MPAAAAPLENPFWNGGSFRPAGTVDTDTMQSLRVLHTLCGQLASGTTQAIAERHRVDNLLALLADLAAGTAGEVGAHGATWDTLTTNQAWDLTRLYARVALDYAWAASRIAGKLAHGKPVTTLHEWPDHERYPGNDWLTADPGRRVYPVQLPPPPARLGGWYAEQVATLNPFLADSHRQMLDAVVRVLKVHPDDLRTDGLAGERLEPEDRAAYDPRQAHLHTAAVGLHTYASGCARAVVLLDVTSTTGGTDAP